MSNILCLLTYIIFSIILAQDIGKFKRRREESCIRPVEEKDYMTAFPCANNHINIKTMILSMKNPLDNTKGIMIYYEKPGVMLVVQHNKTGTHTVEEVMIIDCMPFFHLSN